MRRITPLLLFVGLIAAACGGAETTSSPGASTSTTLEDTTTTLVDPDSATTSVPATTNAPVESSTTIAEPATTIAPATTVATATTIAPATTVAPAPATTVAPAPATTIAPAPDPVTNPAKSQWFEGTEEGDPEASSDGVNCLGFYEAAGVGTITYSACGPWASSDGEYVWTVVKGTSDKFFAIVWKEITPFNWVPKMKLLEGPDDDWDSVTMLAADIDSGPNEELLSGVRIAGTGQYLILDVIDIRSGNPKVVATLPELDSAIAFPDDSVGVYFHTPQRLVGEPNCCPSVWDQFLLFSGPGGWQVEEGWAGFPIGAITGVDAF